MLKFQNLSSSFLNFKKLININHINIKIQKNLNYFFSFKIQPENNIKNKSSSTQGLYNNNITRHSKLSEATNIIQPYNKIKIDANDENFYGIFL